MIISVIVTYNRKDKLQQSISSMFNASLVPDQLIIIDNCSNDGTQELVKQMMINNGSIKLYTTQSNLGGAGGFSLGMKLAYENGADFIWLNDDDAYSDCNALQKLIDKDMLLRKNNIEYGFLCSRVNWVDESICEMNQPLSSWDWMRYLDISSSLIKVDRCSFVSCFFPRKIIDLVGLPVDEFFIWYDDAEYTQRISQNLPCFAVIDSIVVHDTPENKGVNFELVNENNLWKYKHGARNEAWSTLKSHGKKEWLIVVMKKYLAMKSANVPFRIKFTIMLACLSALFKKWTIKKVDDFMIDKYIVKS